MTRINAYLLFISPLRRIAQIPIFRSMPIIDMRRQWSHRKYAINVEHLATIINEPALTRDYHQMIRKPDIGRDALVVGRSGWPQLIYHFIIIRQLIMPELRDISTTIRVSETPGMIIYFDSGPLRYESNLFI